MHLGQLPGGHDNLRMVYDALQWCDQPAGEDVVVAWLSSECVSRLYTKTVVRGPVQLVSELLAARFPMQVEIIC